MVALLGHVFIRLTNLCHELLAGHVQVTPKVPIVQLEPDTVLRELKEHVLY